MDQAVQIEPVDGTLGILWAASLPSLMEHLGPESWQHLLISLQDFHEAVLQQDDRASPLHLLVGGEMGLTLALCLHDLPECGRLKKRSLDAMRSWCRADRDAVAAAVSGGVNARLVLASLVRCKRLITAGQIKPFDKATWKEMGESLAIWVAAMATPGGGSAMSAAARKAVLDDVRPEGLLDHAIKFDSETLKPAMAAALGATPTGGRLAWQVSLPETMHHDADAKLAVMIPEWDVRRGRMHVDYSGRETRLELFAGRAQILSGTWQTSIDVDGDAQQPSGQWQEVCEYTDDDVHYLEIEQLWSGGLLLQRQMMLVRDDRCVLLADAVLPADTNSEITSAAIGSIRYTSRIPLAGNVQAIPEDETTEILLSKDTKRAMVLPLSAGEWRMGATSSSLSATDEGELVMMGLGEGRLYVPTWFDLQPRRFKRNCTWRQLTVTDQLRIAGSDEAVGYRVQVGSEQWMIYRSLSEHRSRCVLGKHLIADFFCSRFDPGDGSHEELITVDDSESSDDA